MTREYRAFKPAARKTNDVSYTRHLTSPEQISEEGLAARGYVVQTRIVDEWLPYHEPAEWEDGHRGVLVAEASGDELGVYIDGEIVSFVSKNPLRMNTEDMRDLARILFEGADAIEARS